MGLLGSDYLAFDEVAFEIGNYHTEVPDIFFFSIYQLANEVLAFGEIFEKFPDFISGEFASPPSLEFYRVLIYVMICFHLSL